MLLMFNMKDDILALCVNGRSRFLQMRSMRVVNLRLASFALKALHCLKNIINVLRYFQDVNFLHLLILKSSLPESPRFQL